MVGVIILLAATLVVLIPSELYFYQDFYLEYLDRMMAAISFLRRER